MDEAKIVVVDEDAKFDEMIEHLMMPHIPFIGLDCEDAIMCKGLALIQISTLEKTFLLDPLSLRISGKTWSKLTNIFHNPTKIITGNFHNKP